MLLKHISLLLLFSSCALFQNRSPLKLEDGEKLLDAVKLTGEGRGRISFGPGQYVFGVDSVLNEKFDWILAVSIPLHGEEVMIFPELKKSEIQGEEVDTFEERIEKEFQRIKLHKKLSSKEFLKELRALIRFKLSPAWGQNRNCRAQQENFICLLDGKEFVVTVVKGELKITKSLGNEGKLILTARNLTNSFFAQTDIRLFLNPDDSRPENSDFTLELFWKDSN